MTSSLVDMKRTGLALLAVLALVAAGCGGSSSSSSSSPSSSQAAPASSGTSSTPSGGGNVVTISMKNIQFNPKAQTVKVGQTVKWVNEDSVPHDVMGGPLKSSTFGQGGSYTYKATKPGKISYVCTIHPGMTGTLTVTS